MHDPGFCPEARRGRASGVPRGDIKDKASTTVHRDKVKRSRIHTHMSRRFLHRSAFEAHKQGAAFPSSELPGVRTTSTRTPHASSMRAATCHFQLPLATLGQWTPWDSHCSPPTMSATFAHACSPPLSSGAAGALASFRSCPQEFRALPTHPDRIHACGLASTGSSRIHSAAPEAMRRGCARLRRSHLARRGSSRPEASSSHAPRNLTRRALWPDEASSSHTPPKAVTIAPWMRTGWLAS